VAVAEIRLKHWTMAQILLIEDEASIRRVLSKILKEESDSYTVLEAENGEKGLQVLENEEIDLVLCDIKMPKIDGIEVLERSRKTRPEVPFIMISGHGDLEVAVQSMKLGAFDYISKPPDLNRLLTTVRNALDRKELVTENRNLRKRVDKNYEMIGDSQELRQVKEIIEKVAPTDARVLITGSNGTGKELVAHWLHQKSERSTNPMLAVNCAAIPSELIESELFGHVKGAFTSAVKDRAGKFEAANKGTLFLDEIGDMSLAAQSKVLRALQENKISRVGSDKTIAVDVRVLAATNKDLKEEIRAGRFREDLFHRLAVIEIRVPSLNERRGDIPALAEHFAGQIAEQQGRPPKTFSKKAMKLIQEMDWTGNIRELRNVVERLLILGGNPIDEDDVTRYAMK